jgi:polyphosphate kinase
MKKDDTDRMTTHSTQTTPPTEPIDPRQIPQREKILNRELSWLEFNHRVLELAIDERTPLLERVKFLAIFSSNLDEFVMKRIGGLRRQLSAGSPVRSMDGRSPREQLELIREVVLRHETEQAQCFANNIAPALANEGIEIVDHDELTEEELRTLQDWWRVSVFPVLTPLAVDPGHRFPFISNLSTSLGVMLRESGMCESLFARVKIPKSLPHWVRTDAPDTALSPPKGSPLRLVSLKNVIMNNLGELFPGMEIIESAPFRVTRNADVEQDEEDADDLLESIEEEMKQRRFAHVVRLEVWPDAPRRLLNFLTEELGISPDDVYQRRGPMDYRGLLEIAELDMPDLRDPPWRPVVPPRLADEDADIFAIIRKGDLLIHNPYESFGATVEKFILTAARDPKTLAIKQTLYRTSGDSPFVSELMRAAENQKQVACLVELRARFDEMANVQWAQMLEKAGVHVAYGVIGLKTHCKVSLVVRQEPDAPGGIRCYAHIGTGNYNSQTAQLYTDMHLLTCDPVLTADVVELFNYLTGRSMKRDYRKLLVAPVCMRRKLEELIDREIDFAKQGKPARIAAKMNAFADTDLADRLYLASQMGVKVDLIVRGFSCIRPGVPGMSENIRVLSIVGRFLEHARFFHFSAGKSDPAQGDWHIGSPDWMHRNLNNRVEAAAPVRDPALKAKLASTLGAMLSDRRYAWKQNPDGSYTRLEPSPSADPDSVEAIGAFEWLMRQAGQDSSSSP